MVITTDNQEQGWLDHFNERYGYDFKMNEQVEVTTEFKGDISDFNHYVAGGYAIRLVKEVTE